MFTALHDPVNKVYVCVPDMSGGHRAQNVNISLACLHKAFFPKWSTTQQKVGQRDFCYAVLS